MMLLRHGRAEAASIDARTTARWFAAHPAPTRVLVSPARRTRDTVAAAFPGGIADLRIEPRIYDATPGTLLQIIAEHADAERLLLVGHNPGFEETVALLTSGQSGDHRGMPPAGLALLALVNAEADPGSATLLEFWSP